MAFGSEAMLWLAGMNERQNANKYKYLENALYGGIQGYKDQKRLARDVAKFNAQHAIQQGYLELAQKKFEEAKRQFDTSTGISMKDRATAADQWRTQRKDRLGEMFANAGVNPEDIFSDPQLAELFGELSGVRRGDKQRAVALQKLETALRKRQAEQLATKREIEIARLRREEEIELDPKRKAEIEQQRVDLERKLAEARTAGVLDAKRKAGGEEPQQDPAAIQTMRWKIDQIRKLMPNATDQQIAAAIFGMDNQAGGHDEWIAKQIIRMIMQEQGKPVLGEEDRMTPEEIQKKYGELFRDIMGGRASGEPGLGATGAGGGLPPLPGAAGPVQPNVGGDIQPPNWDNTPEPPTVQPRAEAPTPSAPPVPSSGAPVQVAPPGGADTGGVSAGGPSAAPQRASELDIPLQGDVPVIPPGEQVDPSAAWDAVHRGGRTPEDPEQQLAFKKALVRGYIEAVQQLQRMSTVYGQGDAAYDDLAREVARRKATLESMGFDF